MRYGYTRVSTEEQDTEAQKIDLLKEGLSVDLIFSEKISGAVAAKNRPILGKLISMMTEGDSLTVVKLDRLGRDAIDVLKLLKDLKNRGVTVRILQLGADTGGSAGTLILGILASVAEWERKVISERTIAGMAAAKKAGKLIGRRKSLSERQLQEARRRLAENESPSDVARLFGVTRQIIYRVKNDNY